MPCLDWTGLNWIVRDIEEILELRSEFNRNIGANQAATRIRKCLRHVTPRFRGGKVKVSCYVEGGNLERGKSKHTV